MAEIELPCGVVYWMEKGHGAPVVFVHGIPTDSRAWNGQIDAVAAEFRAVVFSRRWAFPNRGRGAVSDSTVEANADDLAELVLRLQLPPAHLVGHSYGGFIAAYLATRRPELIRSLTLVEPAIASLLLRDPKSRLQALGLLLRSPATAVAASRYLRDSHGPAMRALAAGDEAAAVHLNVDGVEGRVGAFQTFSPETRQMMIENGRTVRETDLPYPPLSSVDLRRIPVPTRVISGGTSALWLRSIARSTARSIPGAELRTIPGAGHYPHVQQTSAFNDLLLEFLRAH
jgi:pimeloyl-ACP methyl ester carboxylesterase